MKIGRADVRDWQFRWLGWLRASLRNAPGLDLTIRGTTVRDRLRHASSSFTRRVAPDPLTVDGHRLRHLGDSEEVLSMAWGTFEPDTTRLVRRLLAPGRTFVDVGAHIGYYTLLSARAVGPAGKVYAFEPNPRARELLRTNVAANGYANVTVAANAVAGACGTARLFLSRNSLWSTLSDYWGGDSTPVEAVTLDAYFDAAGWPPVDLVKLDVEGGECNVLAGMREVSRRNAGLRLVVEANSGNLRQFRTTPEALLEAIHELGFRRLSVIGRELLPFAGVGGLFDVLRAKSADQWSANILCER